MILAARLAATRSAILGALFLAAWLFLAAVPAFADGGPHIASQNSGVSSLTTDSCAGCHRVHTAQAPMLLKSDEEGLCLTCHGASVTGATTDVESGLQYAVDNNDTAILGALRSGGFVSARIATATPARSRYDSGMTDFYAKVSVGAAGAVTSAHLPALAGLTQPGVAWGNGANDSGPGPTVTLGCASCHNPHGNGQYRILNPIPDPAEISGTFTPVAAPGARLTVENPDATESDTKNYTVIQQRGPAFLLFADDVTALGFGPTTGDYFRRYVPWNVEPSGSTGRDAPNGLPTSFTLQMNNWCLSCHTRYSSDDPNSERVDPISGEPDMVFRFQHQTTTNGQTVCTTCHVSHGSNATMTGPFSSVFPYPDDPTTAPPALTSASSRLLKVDGRGTCQLCHDPTDTVLPGDYSGPIPAPGVP